MFIEGQIARVLRRDAAFKFIKRGEFAKIGHKTKINETERKQNSLLSSLGRSGGGAGLAIPPERRADENLRWSKLVLLLILFRRMRRQQDDLISAALEALRRSSAAPLYAARSRKSSLKTETTCENSVSISLMRPVGLVAAAAPEIMEEALPRFQGETLPKGGSKGK